MRSYKKRWVKRGLIVSVAALVLAVGVPVYLLQLPPPAWRKVQAVLGTTTPEMRETVATNVKHRIVDLVDTDSAGFRPLNEADGPWLGASQSITEVPVDAFTDLKMTNSELLMVVNDFFVQWSQQRGYIVPGGVNTPSVIAVDGKLILAWMIETPYWQQVFSGEVSLDFKPDGMAVGKVENLYAGSLPLSILTVGEMLRLQMPESEHEMADRLGRWLAKLDHFEFRPTIELDHRRRARVVAMKVEDSGVSVRLRVQDHQTYRAHNELLWLGEMAVTDVFDQAAGNGRAFADVPTTTE